MFKAGLHKSVEELFDGVSLPQDSDAQVASCESTSDNDASSVKEMLIPSHLTREIAKTNSTTKIYLGFARLRAKLSSIIAVKNAISVKSGPLLEKLKVKALNFKSSGKADKNKMICTILMPFLFVIFVAAIVNAFYVPADNSSTPAVMVQSNASAAPEPNQIAKISWNIPESYPDTLRDPTQFGNITPGSMSSENLNVKGIIYSSENPIAIIGSKLVHQGEVVFGAKILSIDQDSVTFEMDGKRWKQDVKLKK